MQLVVAGTGPVNDSILIGHVDILAALFDKAILPAFVRDELKHRKAPLVVLRWIANPPSWAEVRRTSHAGNNYMEKLDPGEKEAIALAM